MRFLLVYKELFFQADFVLQLLQLQQQKATVSFSLYGFRIVFFPNRLCIVADAADATTTEAEGD